MPPRRSARVAAVAELATSALSPLPLSVVLHIFSLLPVDCRLLCMEVCRGWRSVLLERSLWTRLDLTAASGVRVRVGPHAWGDEGAALDGLLRCAAARAGGGLQALHYETRNVTHAALLAVAAANAGALRELHSCPRVVGQWWPLVLRPEQTVALLTAAPQLRVFITDFNCGADDADAARRALRNEAPFGPLRVRHLEADLTHEDEAGVVAFAADAAAHASLRELSLRGAPLSTAAALDAVVDAALAQHMQSVTLHSCRCSPASVPALVRLLGSDKLTTLQCWHMNLLDAPTAAMLAAALRANATITSLALNATRVFDDDAAAGAALLDALNGHASLRVLNICDNHVGAAPAQKAAAGAALGALVTANAPALTQLHVSFCNLGDAGLRPLFEALPANTHLRELYCIDPRMSEAFCGDVALPAVRANTSLRHIHTGITAWDATNAIIALELRGRAPL
jgi:hypothetical protein